MTSRAMSIILALGALPCFAQSNLLQIVSPRSGTVVHPGETVVIAVIAAPSVSNVAIESPLGFSQRTNGQGLQFLLTIPSNTTIGAYDVSAMGTADGSLAASPPISLQVDIPKSRFNMQTEPSVLRFDAPGETMPLHVIGIFANGSKMDMTHSTQMSYSSQNPQIATVDDQGIVTAVAPGSTRIVVNNGTYSYMVSTRVGLLARIAVPSPDSMLHGSSIKFLWTTPTRATAYRIEVGSTPGADDYYQSGSLATTANEQIINNLPTDGSKIYVTLWTEINGKWGSSQFTYTAFNQGKKFAGANKGVTVREETKAGNDSPLPKPALPLVFILSNGERIESSNYVLTVDSLQVEQSGRQRTIPMSTVDLNATLAANRERGIDLQIPTGKSQIMVSFWK
jgi:hypothetical protein